MFSPSQIITTLRLKNHFVLEADQQPYNLNIIGIRNHNSQPNTFDDHIVLLWQYKHQWNIRLYPATTDPGTYHLTNPASVTGTAILKEGQYLRSFQLGLHQGRYKALVQCLPVTVIRDPNRDTNPDFDTPYEERGIFGINIHRASPTATSTRVDKWSAGCQVIANHAHYDEFISLCSQSAKYWGKLFSYTLINSNDL